MCVGHEKHCTRNTLKVKFTRSCDVVALKHRIYPVNITRQWKCIGLIGNRGRRSEWWAQISDWKFVNSCYCTFAVKICPKLAYGVVKSLQFQSFYKKSWSLNTMGRAVSRLEAELTLFLRMRTNEIVKTQQKCILTEELFPCYRKWGSPKRTERSDFFYQNLESRRICACAVKIGPKLAYCVVKSPQFLSSYKKSWSLNTNVRAVFKPEAESTLILRMRTKEIVKTQQKCIPTEELFPCYRKWGSPKRTARSHFDRKLVSRRFCACAVKNRPKTRLLCCQIAKILAPLWTIAVAEHDGI